MPVRWVVLIGVAVVCAGAQHAEAKDYSGRPQAAPVFPWAPVSLKKDEWVSPAQGTIRAEILSAPAQSATRTLDLNKLSMSDFGDVDTAR